MNKKPKMIVLIALSIASSYIITNIISIYSTATFLSDVESINQLQFDDVQNRDIINQEINDFSILHKKEKNVFYTFNYDRKNQVLEYYNPHDNEEFELKINVYKNLCSVNCILIRELSEDQINKNNNYTIYGNLNSSPESKYFIVLEDQDDHNHEETDTEYEYLNKFYLFSIAVCLIVLNVIIILDFIKSIPKIDLSSKLGYNFFRVYINLLKSECLFTYVVYLLFSLLFTYIFSRLIFNVAIALVLLIVFVVLSIAINIIFSRAAYLKLERTFKYKFSSILSGFISIIVALLVLINVLFAVISVKQINMYTNSSYSMDTLDGYYSVNLSEIIDIEIEQEIYRYLLKNQDAIERYYIPSIDPNMSAQISIDPSFFVENSDITDLNGNQINPSFDDKCTYFVTNKSEELLDKIGGTTCDVVIIKAENKYYASYVETYDATRNNKFNIDETLIIFDPELVSLSLLLVKADSESDAIEKVSDALAEFGLDVKITISSYFHYYFHDEIARDTISYTIVLFLSIIGSILMLMFYIQILYKRYQDHIVLATVMGMPKHLVLKPIIKELLIINMIVLILIISLALSILSVTIFILILIIEYILLVVKVNQLLKQGLVLFLKGEQQ